MSQTDNFASPSAVADEPPRQPERPRSVLRRWGCTAVVVAVLFGLLIVVGAECNLQREFDRRISCQNNLRQIAMALQTYYSRNRCFPPAYVVDENGKPMHSWRALLLPYIECSNIPYDRSRPWDSPKNKVATSLAILLFRCPSDRSSPNNITNYVAVVGPGTMWDGNRPVRDEESADGADTILLVEIANSDIQWAEPRDLTLDEVLEAIESKSGKGISSNHPVGICCAKANGEVIVLDRDIDADTLRKMLLVPPRPGP
jgi:hypothetical protein